MKERNCRMTQQEKETHKQAAKLRRMTDAKLMEFIQAKERETMKWQSKATALSIELEAAKKSIVANESRADSNRNDSGEQFTAESVRREETDVRGLVEGLVDALSERVGCGIGIGPGTISKIRRIVAGTSDDRLREIVTKR